MIETWYLRGFMRPLKMKLRSTSSTQAKAMLITIIQTSVITLLVAPICCEQ